MPLYSTYPIAMQLQADLQTLCDAGAPPAAFINKGDLIARCGGEEHRVPALVRITRKLTESEYWPLASTTPNPYRLPGYGIPFVSVETGGLLIMNYGASGATAYVLITTSLRRFKTQRTWTQNSREMWANILLGIPSSARRERDRVRRIISQMDAADDANRLAIDRCYEILHGLHTAEAEYLDSLHDWATA